MRLGFVGVFAMLAGCLGRECPCDYDPDTLTIDVSALALAPGSYRVEAHGDDASAVSCMVTIATAGDTVPCLDTGGSSVGELQGDRVVLWEFTPDTADVSVWSGDAVLAQASLTPEYTHEPQNRCGCGGQLRGTATLAP